MNTPAKLSTFEKFKQSGYLDDVPDDIAPKLVNVIVSQAYSCREQEYVNEYQTALAKEIMIRFPTELIEVFKVPVGLTKNNLAKAVFTSRYHVPALLKEEIINKDPALIKTVAEKCVLFLFEQLLRHDYSTIYTYTLCELCPIDQFNDSFFLTYRAVFE